MAISAVDTITPAFQHTKRQLFQPFRFGQWSRLAFVGLLAGELGSGGSSKFPTSLPRSPGSSGHGLGEIFPKIDPALLAGLIAFLLVAAFIFVILMMYISSVMRFILFDSVVAKHCEIRQGWRRRQSPGWKYFLWQLGFMFATIGGFVLLVGIPLALAFALGWFNAPREHVLGLVLGGIVWLPFLLLFFFVAAVVHVLTKDFVVPQMALEGIGAVEGWRRLWPMIQLEKGGYAIVRSHEDCVGDWRGYPCRSGLGDSDSSDRDSDCRTRYHRGLGRKDSRPHMECFYDHAGGGCGVHIAGGFSLSDGPDFCSRHRVLSRILDLFLCGPI